MTAAPFAWTASYFSGRAIAVAMPVSPPTVASSATANAAIPQPTRYRRSTFRSRIRSTPSATRTHTLKATTYSIVLGARKNFVPGTRA
jgi:hypothetical protein